MRAIFMTALRCCTYFEQYKSATAAFNYFVRESKMSVTEKVAV